MRNHNLRGGILVHSIPVDLPSVYKAWISVAEQPLPICNGKNTSTNHRHLTRPQVNMITHAADKAIMQTVAASPRVHILLQELHAKSEAQEQSFSQRLFYLKRLVTFYLFGSAWTSSGDDHMRDKFVGLERDKCQLLYLLARSSNARNVVEAGTSFGLSTIYLALAVGQNVADARKASGQALSGKVIATEKEPSKAQRARHHWKQAGDEVEPWIELRQGNLLETLKGEGMPEQIDLLLLDGEFSPRGRFDQDEMFD